MKTHKNSPMLSQLIKKIVILIFLTKVVTVCAEPLVVSESEEEIEKKTRENTISSMNATLRTFQTVSGTLPNNIESLISVSPGKIEVKDSDNISKNTTKGGFLNTFLHPQLAIKLDAKLLTAAQTRNLRAVGIDKIRYIDINGDTAKTEFHKLVIKAPIQGGRDAFVGPINDMKSILQAYSVPILGSTHYGRGFVVQLPELPEEGENYNALNARVAVWKRNDLVEAKSGAVLVAFGIGRESTLISNGSQNRNMIALSSPPFCSTIIKKQYGHYIMLVDVSVSPARFVACVDAKCGIFETD